ncbi:MAG: hypothetical protein QNJ41_28615 [Xenococcaceae cyanobacterium MO_188.B32]|nr:hypothetical protein [Xenococcaceae cyanobacterium MO_188.B32]
MTTETITTQTSEITPVSEATKALVEQKLPEQPDEIKQKMGELVELIKKQAELELESAQDITRETYVKAIANAKATLKQTETFFAEQEQTLQQKIQELNTQADREWESFLGDVKNMGDRIDKAINAAWKALTEEKS